MLPIGWPSEFAITYGYYAGRRPGLGVRPDHDRRRAASRLVHYGHSHSRPSPARVVPQRWSPATLDDGQKCVVERVTRMLESSANAHLHASLIGSPVGRIISDGGGVRVLTAVQAADQCDEGLQMPFSQVGRS